MDDRVVLTLERVILVDLNRLEISPLMSLQISHTDQLILEIFFPIVQYLLPAVKKSETFLRWSDPPIDSYYLQACLCFKGELKSKNQLCFYCFFWKSWTHKIEFW